MKNLFLSLVVALAFASVGQAATISVVETVTAGGKAFALTLTAPAAEQFNGFGVVASPGSSVFVNPGNGAPADTAGSNKTFISAFLEAPVAFGGHGLTLPSRTVSETVFSFDAGLLGSFINASGGIFLGNVVLPAGASGSYTVALSNTGNTIQTLTGPLGIPEPGTLVMAGMSLVGLAFRRRNG